MKSYIVVATLVGLMLVTGTAVAQVVTPAPSTTVIQAGNTFYDLMIAYAGIVGTIVSALASWALWKFTGIKMESNHRNAIETFVNNAAGAFLVKFEDLKEAGNIDVHNPVIAQLANAGLGRIKDALDYFGLDADHLKQRIVEKIGILTAVPAVATAPTVVTPTIPRV